MLVSLTGHIAAIGLLLFAVGFTLVVYYRSRRDVEEIRKEMHQDMEKMTQSLLYVIDGLTKIQKESTSIIEEHEEYDKKIEETLEHLNEILDKTQNGSGNGGSDDDGGPALH